MPDQMANMYRQPSYHPHPHHHHHHQVSGRSSLSLFFFLLILLIFRYFNPLLNDNDNESLILRKQGLFPKNTAQFSRNLLIKGIEQQIKKIFKQSEWDFHSITV